MDVRHPTALSSRQSKKKFELIAAGEAVAIIPASTAVSALRPDLITVPLEGVEPSHVVLATRADDRSRLVAAFRKYAQAHLTGPAPATLASVLPHEPRTDRRG